MEVPGERRGKQMEAYPENNSATEPENPVLVVGAAGIDMISMVDDPPQSGTTQPANIRVAIGGVARNVAENLARLGMPVEFITAVGDDQSGDVLLKTTAACGVGVGRCLRSSVNDTGAYLLVLDQAGTRYLALEDMLVITELTPQMISNHRAAIAEAPFIFIDANLPDETIDTILGAAALARVRVCADATSPRLAVRLIPHLNRLHMITANPAEASTLVGGDLKVTDQETALQAARRLVNRGVELAVVTLAEFGVVYATTETSGHIPAVSTRVVDPTGAGDALTATVIFGLLNDIPIDESVRLGVTAASLILRHRGTVLPGLSLEKLYDELVV
jgi:pseudouridine kinase